ncbi:DUF997 family protein [Lignipirellula cremea]|uniref:DUF997 domain-containing protein n=1 Tax=Lignipirellula cremea TaxID=2528010 RepID=A0A518DLX1_9BACT|nr:DUF997 family protein [Lignipirellula cremea]QDU92825.1 hypothetical protein Pla8534_05980 [Lignipirellula cremea]
MSIPDPVYLNARRESFVIVALFAVFILWSVTVCVYFGYLPTTAEGEAPEISLVLGMPAWAFWGLLAPWLAVDVVAFWFCFFFMKNDDLGEEQVSDVPQPSHLQNKLPPHEESNHA